jgi:hypothetical protein
MIVESRIENLSKFKIIFWDSDVSAIDIDQYKIYIIERILELGDVQEVKWMFARYSKDTIKEVLYTCSDITTKSYQFWQLILGDDNAHGST